MRNSNRQGIEQISYNLEVFQDYYNRMEKIVLSMFEWVNLPESMDARYLEKTLFDFGQAALLKDNTYGFINTKATDDGGLSIYGLPTILHCNSFEYESDRLVYNGLLNESFTEDNQAILVMNDWNRIPTAYSIYDFAERLADAQKTCDINIRAQRTPILILGDEKQQLTLKNLYAKYDGFEPVMYGDSDIMSASMLSVVNTGAPYVADKIQSYKKEIWNEFLTTIGVNNISVEKKERLITGESSENNELINFNLQSFLAPRQKACEQFNKLFGLEGDNKISVRLRSDLFNIIKQQESIITDYNMNGIPDEEEGVLDE